VRSNRLAVSRMEERTMSRTTWRKISVSAFVVFAVLGTGWVVERASSNAHMQGGAAISESVKATDAVVTPVSQPAATNSSEEYDRSDLLLSQG
jgi:hypothetical protein